MDSGENRSRDVRAVAVLCFLFALLHINLKTKEDDMRCQCCNRILSSGEINFNKFLKRWDFCGTCKDESRHLFEDTSLKPVTISGDSRSLVNWDIHTHDIIGKFDAPVSRFH